MTFPALSVGLAIFVAICYGAYYKTNNPVYLQMFRFRRRIFTVAFAIGVVAGSIWRLADGEHGGDQVIQRPGQVVLSDQDNPVIDAKMVNRPSRNRVVGRRDSQGT